MKNIVSALALLVFVGCATTPELTPQQRRALQVKTFNDTTYDNVFRAFKTVLQDEGYIIKNQDMQGGLILATIQKTDKGAKFMAIMNGDSNYRTGEGYEVAINFEQINKSTVESRLVVQKLETYSQGGSQGNEILEPTLYQSLYQKVATEVSRRSASGRG